MADDSLRTGGWNEEWPSSEKMLRQARLDLARRATRAARVAYGSSRAVGPLGKALWLVIAGWWLFLVYLLAGLLSLVLVITVPYAPSLFRASLYVLWPFGRVVVVAPIEDSRLMDLWGKLFCHKGSWMFMALVSLLPAYVIAALLALAHMVASVVLMVTGVGLPVGLWCFKLKWMPFLFTRSAGTIRDIGEAQRAGLEPLPMPTLGS